jgi:hypothetical protein
MKWQVRRFYSGDWAKPWGWTDWCDALPEEAASVIAANRPDIQARQVDGACQ